MSNFVFTFKGSEFRADWLGYDQQRLSVRTSETVEDDKGIEMTEWPSDTFVSGIVGKAVYLHDAGEHPTESECIFYAEVA
jgi:hypothetical protein